MIKNLVIVESPAKAKTIEKFLGEDFVVKSSYGHIRDLSDNGLGIDLNNNFEPDYQISADKEKVVAELKKLSKDAQEVWLATDEDREGEAISWHLAKALGLNIDSTKRIVFHEITKPAILKAIQNPRKIDQNLVNAQQARRVLDRLVGFELSPVLWKKVKPSLSAGRVQSVAVKLIVEREREINSFNTASSFKVTADFHPIDEKTNQIQAAVLKAELPERFKTQEQAEEFLKSCIDSNFKILDIEVKPGYKSPSAPFTTSTLQQEASRKLGYSVTRTMQVAQKLYEAGHITYMRTDSVNLSETAVEDIKKQVISHYGPNYSNPKKYANKNESAQEAHEAIRPTYISIPSAGEDDSEKRLYDLIWKRTIASQMSNAILEKTNVKIEISKNKNHQFQAFGEVLKFDGFLKVYLESKDDETEDEDVKGMLPPLAVGQNLDKMDIQAIERFSRPPARYSEAALVKKLEELGIGRPSTYAPTITTVQKRQYVEKSELEGHERKFQALTLKKNNQLDVQTQTEITGKDKGKLVPTNIGMVVNDFLDANFSQIMDYNFTASVEKQFDNIADGTQVWKEMIGSFYLPFHQTVDDTLKNSERAKGERLLGVDPKSGDNIYAKMGRYGAMIQIGELTDDGPKPKYAKIRSGQFLETITLEDALELFKLPKELGEMEDQKILVNIGRFGPYVQVGKEFFSLPKGEDPYELKLDRALEIILEKREDKLSKLIQDLEFDGKPLQILKGRFGPYISWNKLNVTLPKDVDPNTISLEECVKLIEAKKANPTVKKGKFGKAAPKTDDAAAPKKAAPKKTITKKATTKASPKPKKK